MSYLTKRLKSGNLTLLNWHKQQASSLHRHRVLQRENIYFGSWKPAYTTLSLLLLLCCCCCVVVVVVLLLLLLLLLSF